MEKVVGNCWIAAIVAVAGWFAGLKIIEGEVKSEKISNMNGNLNAARFAYQSVPVKTASGIRETFTLSSWAKG